jgi:hypothetical protein
MPSPVADPDPSREARALRFDRDTELARPDIYRVALSSDEGRIDATLAADDHAVGLRAESHSGALAIIVDHLGEAVDASWAVDGGELRIDVRLRDASGEHFVHARIPDPASVRLVREGGRLRGSVEIAGARTDVVVGVSSIGPDEARDHAAAGIDDMLCRAHDAWVTAFSRLEVEGAPPALRRAIAGSLARVFAYPNRHDEDGRYRSPVDGGVRDGVQLEQRLLGHVPHSLAAARPARAAHGCTPRRRFRAALPRRGLGRSLECSRPRRLDDGDDE